MSDNTHSVDLQDPLPESSWFWRRVFVFAVTSVVLWFLWGAIDRLGAVALISPVNGVPALLELCKWIISLTILMATYYMIAPSAEQIVKIFKVAALIRNGALVSEEATPPAQRLVPPAQGSSAVAPDVKAAGDPPWDRPPQ